MGASASSKIPDAGSTISPAKPAKATTVSKTEYMTVTEFMQHKFWNFPTDVEKSPAMAGPLLQTKSDEPKIDRVQINTDVSILIENARIEHHAKAGICRYANIEVDLWGYLKTVQPVGTGSWQPCGNCSAFKFKQLAKPFPNVFVEGLDFQIPVPQQLPKDTTAG